MGGGGQVGTDTLMYCRGWSGAKPGRASEKNQDAFGTRLIHDVTGDGVLLVICDGATSTVQAGAWAQALVAAAEADWPSLDDDTLTSRLDAVRERFQLAIPEDLPWYMAQKMAKEGSQATLTVASFSPVPGSAEISLRTIAIGDSPLILFRTDGSTASFPLGKSADFGVRPRLVSSKPQPSLKYERWNATLRPGDIVVGCTDAVGKWTLESVESADSNSVFRLLAGVLGADGSAEAGTGTADVSLSNRIAASANQRRLEEDDVTLVLCVPCQPGSADTPLDFAQKVLTGHLTGDFAFLRGALPPRVTAWDRFLRTFRTALKRV